MDARAKRGTLPKRVGRRTEQPDLAETGTIERTSLLAPASLAAWSLSEMKASVRRQLRFFGHADGDWKLAWGSSPAPFRDRVAWVRSTESLCALVELLLSVPVPRVGITA